MGYARQVYTQAENELNRRRTTAQDNAQRRLENFYAVCPEAEDVRRRIASTASRAAMAVLRSGNARETMEALKNENLSLQKQFADLLAAHGLTRADIEPQYTCKRCEDTGYVDGRICSCYRSLLKQIAYENLNRISPLTLSSFEDFSLLYYSDVSVNGERSDREQMRNIYDFCRRYADNFKKDSGNLFFTGATGLGKTHLSLAIAAEAINKGFGVVYGTAQTFALALERERFTRTEESGGDTLDLLNDCDLLIIDDLGTEMNSTFVQSALYQLINGRLLGMKSTIISTNLTPEDIGRRYSQQVYSRIEGEYTILPFIGTDIRQLKRQRGEK